MASLIHSTIRRLVIGAEAVVTFGGCQQAHDHWEWTGRHYDAVMAKPREEINRYVRPSMAQTDTVIADPAPDAAAVARGWEPVSLAYPNGAVIAGPNYGISYEDRPGFL